MRERKDSDDAWHEEARALRTQNALRRRWLSFISVFAVVCVAIILMLFSVRWTATPCQQRAKHIELVMFTKTNVPANGPVLAAVGDVLSLNKFRMSPKTNTSDEFALAEQHSFLDTPTRQLRDNSLELRYSLRSTLDRRYPYEYMLRYISQDLCLDRPSFPLDAEYNVDDEYASRSIKAMSDTETTFYFFQSAVRTSQRNKMRFTNDVASTFPSTRGALVSGPLVPSETCETRAERTARIFFDRTGVPLPTMALRFESWRCCENGSGDCRTFGAVRILYSAMEEEESAVRVYRQLKARLETLLCDSGDCGVPLYQA